MLCDLWPASNDFLYFPLDDDLGKSDSSSGSMDSFQVGPTLSAGSSHNRYIIASWSCSIKSLFLIEVVRGRRPQTCGLNLDLRVTGYTPNLSVIHLFL